jgi:hypothetical protein
VILLDACHTGTTIGRDASTPSLTPDFVRNVYEQARGLRLLAGATSNQVARERGDVGHGVFTSFVLEALTPHADGDGFAPADRDRRGFVTFDALKDYVCDGVTAYTAAHGLRLQTPEQNESGVGDVVVAEIRRPS